MDIGDAGAFEMRCPWVSADTSRISSSVTSGRNARGMIRMREPFPLEASSERPSPRLRAAPVVMPTSKDFRQGYTCRFIPVGHAAHEVFQVDPPHEFDAVTSSKGEAGVIGPCPRCHIIRAVTCHFPHGMNRALQTGQAVRGHLLPPVRIPHREVFS